MMVWMIGANVVKCSIGDVVVEIHNVVNCEFP